MSTKLKSILTGGNNALSSVSNNTATSPFMSSPLAPIALAFVSLIGKDYVKDIDKDVLLSKLINDEKVYDVLPTLVDLVADSCKDDNKADKIRMFGTIAIKTGNSYKQGKNSMMSILTDLILDKNAAMSSISNSVDDSSTTSYSTNNGSSNSNSQNNETSVVQDMINEYKQGNENVS